MDLIQSLQELDLTKNEARVYIELLSQGACSVGPLISKTKLHRQQVYVALERLVDLKLATEFLKNNRKHFQATSPLEFQRRIKEKQELVQELLPQLSKLQTLAEDPLEVRMLYGNSGLFENLKDLIVSASRSDKLMRIIGGARDTVVYQALGSTYETYVKLLQEAQVRKHLIAPTDGSEEFKVKFAREPGNILKTMRHGLSSPTYTRICRDMISFEIYSADIVVIQIINRAIAKGYLEHFELLWQQAEKFIQD